MNTWGAGSAEEGDGSTGSHDVNLRRLEDGLPGREQSMLARLWRCGRCDGRVRSMDRAGYVEHMSSVHGVVLS